MVEVQNVSDISEIWKLCKYIVWFFFEKVWKTNRLIFWTSLFCWKSYWLNKITEEVGRAQFSLAVPTYGKWVLPTYVTFAYSICHNHIIYEQNPFKIQEEFKVELQRIFG